MSVVVTHLTKQYGPQKAVDDVSFEVQPGQVVGFLGPNGAGKSTTMKIATGYLPPTSGSVEVNGFDVVKAPMDVRRSVGYLAEHNPLYLDTYVREFLNFAGSLHGLKGSLLNNRVKEMIERVGLTPEQSKKIGALSKGYRQRVGLAQALIHDPPVLILDEPTTGLDPNQIVEIRRVIKEAGKEKTVVFSTHILQEVEALCDRVVIINLGQVVADSSVAALRNLRQNKQTIIAEFSSEVGHYEIVADNQCDVRPGVFQLATEQGLVLIGLRQQENNLERIFQMLTVKS